MGGVPVKHHTKSKVGRRRSHHALKKAGLFVCVNCGRPILPHRLCTECGYYKGRVVKEPKVRTKKPKVN
ncbi:50S ribosomal protein L32 [Candidatus Wolfebacteria bacterium RIFCSPLOWO2_01_FULL_45_19]|uniref:Large ribosomal subunit protein bL32 n=1 Tax=Candidatus Wolfebacteria bacterium RIFCSPLOWO2_01_FULL_45_19 TaxID=1802557 RepID=A0A1F8DST6_9BACT|nr:MAG: 50S ribosomal protein L32 [Candidatus Wolfebacteria bacterium RIFCSPLOWO2_01_FULL_45_19]